MPLWKSLRGCPPITKPTHTHGRTQVAGQSWFGGGCDLTPFYLNEADARAFHAKWQDVCEKHQAGLYPRLKEWCDK